MGQIIPGFSGTMSSFLFLTSELCCCKTKKSFNAAWLLWHQRTWPVWYQITASTKADLLSITPYKTCFIEVWTKVYWVQCSQLMWNPIQNTIRCWWIYVIFNQQSWTMCDLFETSGEHHTNLQFIKLLTMSKTNQDKAYKCLGVKLEW